MSEGTDHDKIHIVDENNSTDTSADKPRRAANKRDDVIPHYLRASTGSCHDACKYGHPHEFKEKVKRPIRRRISASVDGEKVVDIQIFVDKKVKKALHPEKLEPVSAKYSLPDNDKIKKLFPSPKKSPVHDSSKLVKKSPVHDSSKLVEKSPIHSKNVPSPKKSPVYGSSFTISPSPDPPKVIKKVVRSPEKPSLPFKKDISSKRALSNGKERTISASPLKPNSMAVKPLSSKICDHPKASMVLAKKVMTLPTTTTTSLKKTSKVEVKKILVPSAKVVRSTPISGVKVASSNMRKNKTQKDESQRTRVFHMNHASVKKDELIKPVDEKVEEKTLHMIETRENLIQSPSPLSPESLNSSSQATFTSHEADLCTDSEADDSISNYDKQKNDPTRSSTTTLSEDRDPRAMKLKFRRGKVVELQSETNSPRKLRFRQGRILGDNQGVNGGFRWKSYKKRTTDNDKKEPETSPVKVVLKHQDVKTKKDGQVLFNNVIEETASKLVETRKSKVKALVGAFETVISLQEEHKPSASNR